MKYIILINMFLFIYFIQYAQDDTLSYISVADISLNKKILILNDRMFLSCPDSAFVMTRAGGETSARTNLEKETRIYFDNDNQRMVIYAQELYSYTVPDLLSYLEKEYSLDRNYNQLPGAVQIISEDSSHIAISATPCRFDQQSTTFLLNTLWVQNIDSMLIKIDVYMNSLAMPYWEDYLYLTERIFRSIEFGTKAITLEAREETKQIFKTDYSLVFSMPEKYILQIEEGYDFMIINILPVKKIDEESFCKAIIYLGKSPVWFYNSYGFSQSENSMKNGVFLEKRMRGYYFQKPNLNKYLLEYQGEANNISKGMMFHVIIMADSKENLEELREITEQIRLVK